ncbi:hypothetical protein [Sporichthya polymorpha]|uniref:hypothetical protein n=1 Tax=Sporichthya polymorpha TaxID=35751 RepID=UPI000375BD4B|nr:hypothetical protein [Sporichthya polymorpha]
MRVLPRPRFPFRAGRGALRSARRAPAPLLAVVDYRVGPFVRWCATVTSPTGEFSERVVLAVDAEGIYLAALAALDDLRRESGRQVEAEHVLHEDLIPA